MKKIHKKLNNIEYIVVEPAYIKPDMMYPVIFLLHGYGSNMSDLANICEHIDSNEYIYVCPNAPLEIDIGFGNKGYSWFDIDTEYKSLEDNYSNLINELIFSLDKEYCIDRKKMILGGFSQGAMVTYEFGIMQTNYFSGLLAMSGKLINKEIFVKVRSTGKLLKSKLNIEKDRNILNLLEDEYGISPGQACAFYSKDSHGFKVLGGGWITK